MVEHPSIHMKANQYCLLHIKCYWTPEFWHYWESTSNLTYICDYCLGWRRLSQSGLTWTGATDQVCPGKKETVSEVDRAQGKDWPADISVFDGNQDPPTIHYLTFCLRFIEHEFTNRVLFLLYSWYLVSDVGDRPTEGPRGRKSTSRSRLLPETKLFADSSVRMQMRRISGLEFKTNKEQSTYIIRIIILEIPVHWLFLGY